MRIKWKVDLRNITQLAEEAKLIENVSERSKDINITNRMRSNTSLIRVPKDENREEEGTTTFKEAMDKDFLEV